MTTELKQGAANETDLDQIIRELNVDWFTSFPEEAIRTAQRHREAITPKLIEVLRSATAAAKAGNAPIGSAPTIALFLLAEFEATEALPAVIEAIALPDSDSYELFGEVLTDDIARILAVLAADRLDAIDGLIRNPEICDYVRWTFTETYGHLFRDGLISRETGLEHLGCLLREVIEAKDDSIVPGLVMTLLKFAPEECYDDIKKAYEMGIADDEIVSLDEIREVIDGGEKETHFELEKIAPTRVTDTVEELKGWACFHSEDEYVDENDDASLDQEPFYDLDAPDSDFQPRYESAEPVPEPLISTIRSNQPRVGRNQPCPCGSGKKFKRCCGSRA